MKYFISISVFFVTLGALASPMDQSISEINKVLREARSQIGMGFRIERFSFQTNDIKLFVVNSLDRNNNSICYSAKSKPFGNSSRYELSLCTNDEEMLDD